MLWTCNSNIQITASIIIIACMRVESYESTTCNIRSQGGNHTSTVSLYTLAAVVDILQTPVTGSSCITVQDDGNKTMEDVFCTCSHWQSSLVMLSFGKVSASFFFSSSSSRGTNNSKTLDEADWGTMPCREREREREMSGSGLCTGIIIHLGVPDYALGWLPLGWDWFWKLSCRYVVIDFVNAIHIHTCLGL